jgi:putative transcriptional regulator
MYHYTDGGLRNVWLKNGYVERNTPYGKAVAFHDLDGLVVAICNALVKKPGRLTGAEFRYVRNALLLSQKSLGQAVGYTEQAVAKWEKTGKVPKAIDVMLRMLFVRKNNGDKNVSSMLDMLNELDRISNAKIIVTESRSKWKSEIELTTENEEAVAA